MDSSIQKLVSYVNELARKKLVKDTLLLQAGMSTATLLGFVISIFLARSLRPEGFGIYILVYSLYNLINFFGVLGLRLASITSLSQALARKDSPDILRQLGLFIKLALIIGTSILIAGFVLSPTLAHYLYHRRDVGELARWLFLCAPLGIPYHFAVIVLTSLRSIPLLVVVEIANLVIRALILIGILLAGYGLPEVIAGIVAATALTGGISLAVYIGIRRRYHLPHLGHVCRSIKDIDLKRYFKLNLLIAFDKSISTLFNISPLFILGRYGSPSEVAFFKLAYTLFEFPLLLLMAAPRNLLPRMSELKSMDKLSSLKHLYYKVSTLSGFVTFVLYAALLSVVYYVIRYLYGTEYLLSVKLCYIMGIAGLFIGFGIAMSPLYIVMNKVPAAIGLKTGCFLIVLPFMILLIKEYSGFGAAISLVGWRLCAFAIPYIYSMKILHESRGTYSAENVSEK